MDKQLGRVMTEIKNLGLDKNTIIVLWGDHGWHLGDHAMWTKHTNYEQATRIPLIIKAPEIIHGKLSKISHNQKGIFHDIETPYSVVRYHSLVIEKHSLPQELEITAVLEENPDVIMAVQHKEKPIYGVQFHPESIETGHGMKLIKNFLDL